MLAWMPISGIVRRYQPDHRAFPAEIQVSREANYPANLLPREVNMSCFDLRRLRHHAVGFAAVRLDADRTIHAAGSIRLAKCPPVALAGRRHDRAWEVV